MQIITNINNTSNISNNRKITGKKCKQKFLSKNQVKIICFAPLTVI